MPIPAGVVETFDIAGDREDLRNAIYDISPMDTPFMSGVNRGRCTAKFHEWQTDELAAADETNAAIEGDDAAVPDFTATVRLSNRTQISTKTVITTGTVDAIRKAGRGTELAYQIAKKAKELKRDMEAVITGNKASAVGISNMDPQYLGSLETWYETNVDTTGSGGGYMSPDTVIRADGTQRAFIESMLKGIFKGCWDAGGEPNLVMTGSFNKQVASTFTGNATRTDKSEDKRVVAAVDIYVSDFGTHRIVANRFSRSRTVHVCDTKMWDICYLRSFRQHRLAKTGDAEKRQMVVEYTLASRNEAASGIIADLTDA